MEITRVKRGEARNAANRIYFNWLTDGRITWVGAIGFGDAAVFGNNMSDFYTMEEAEADAINWAEQRGATELMIEAPDA